MKTILAASGWAIALAWATVAMATQPEGSEVRRRDGNVFLQHVESIRGPEATETFLSGVRWFTDRRSLCSWLGTFDTRAEYDEYKSLPTARRNGASFAYWMKCKADFLGFDEAHRVAFLGGMVEKSGALGFFVKPDRILAQAKNRSVAELRTVLTRAEMAYLAGYATVAAMRSSESRLPRFFEEWLAEQQVRIPELPLFPTAEPGQGSNVARVYKTDVSQEQQNVGGMGAGVTR